MSKVKDLVVKPISSQDANRIIKQLHYSGKVTQNSQIHFGVFLDGKCGGAIQLGPPIDKRKSQGLVKDTLWNEFLELNRVALADWLPKNSESRALAVVFRILKKHYPHIKWVVSYADATQCGDGTIYRALGFALTGVKKNKTILRLSNGDIVADKTLNNYVGANGELGFSIAKKVGAKPLDGYQIRYIYFLDREYKDKLTVPILPYSEIDKIGAGMYKGKKRAPEV